MRTSWRAATGVSPKGSAGFATGCGFHLSAPGWGLVLFPPTASPRTVLSLLSRRLAPVEGGVVLFGAVDVPEAGAIAFILAYWGLLTAGIVLISGLAASASTARWVDRTLEDQSPAAQGD